VNEDHESLSADQDSVGKPLVCNPVDFKPVRSMKATACPPTWLLTANAGAAFDRAVVGMDDQVKNNFDAVAASPVHASSK
jgi:hypothetical protein